MKQQTVYRKDLDSIGQVKSVKVHIRLDGTADSRPWRTRISARELKTEIEDQELLRRRKEAEKVKNDLAIGG